VNGEAHALAACVLLFRVVHGRPGSRDQAQHLRL